MLTSAAILTRSEDNGTYLLDGGVLHQHHIA
nr:MAG TPA: hypothetical protein [Caudoviricetes sp.]